MKEQCLSQVWKITEMKEGSVYKTESIGVYWVDSSWTQGTSDRVLANQVGGDRITPLSSDDPRSRDFKLCYRRVPDTTPSIVKDVQ